jgi:hypothetical protein
VKRNPRSAVAEEEESSTHSRRGRGGRRGMIASESGVRVLGTESLGGMWASCEVPRYQPHSIIFKYLYNFKLF